MRDSLLPDPASAAAERERAIALLDAAATVAPIRARASLRDCALLQRRAGSGGGPGPEAHRRTHRRSRARRLRSKTLR
jgi:hypothetical protein